MKVYTVTHHVQYEDSRLLAVFGDPMDAVMDANHRASNGPRGGKPHRFVNRDSETQIFGAALLDATWLVREWEVE